MKVFPHAISYPMPVLIDGQIPTPKTVVLYLHGWRGICDHNTDTVEMMYKNFRIESTMKQFPDAAIVMPLSRGHCDDFKNSLVPRFDDFMTWLRQQMNADVNIILAGHSGAYVPMYQLLLRYPHFSSFVKGVICLDAVYGDAGFFAQALHLHSSMKLISVYLKRGGTDAPSKEIVQSAPKQAKAYPALTTEHCQVPAIHLGPCLKELIG